jgi:hypothetical protein
VVHVRVNLQKVGQEGPQDDVNCRQDQVQNYNAVDGPIPGQLKWPGPLERCCWVDSPTEHK